MEPRLNTKQLSSVWQPSCQKPTPSVYAFSLSQYTNVRRTPTHRHTQPAGQTERLYHASAKAQQTRHMLGDSVVKLTAVSRLVFGLCNKRSALRRTVIGRIYLARLFDGAQRQPVSTHQLVPQHAFVPQLHHQPDIHTRRLTADTTKTRTLHDVTISHRPTLPRHCTANTISRKRHEHSQYARSILKF